MRLLLPVLGSLALLVPTGAPAGTLTAGFSDCGGSIRYGDSAANFANYIRTSGIGTVAADTAASALGLVLSCSQGPSADTAAVVVSNPGSTTTEPIRFFAVGDLSADSRPDQVTATGFGTGGQGGASAFGIDSSSNSISFLSGNLDEDIFIVGQLDNSNVCGVPCSAIVSMQWELGRIEPGEAAMVVLRASEAAAPSSGGYLEAVPTDVSGAALPGAERLYLSGEVSSVPEPSLVSQMSAGAAVLAWLYRRRASCLGGAP